MCIIHHLFWSCTELEWGTSSFSCWNTVSPKTKWKVNARWMEINIILNCMSNISECCKFKLCVYIFMYTLAKRWSNCSIKIDINIRKKQTVATAHVGVSSSDFASPSPAISYDYLFLSFSFLRVMLEDPQLPSLCSQRRETN